MFWWPSLALTLEGKMRRMSVFIPLLALLVVTSERAIAADTDFRITLLGTGDPIPRPERFD